MTDLQVGDRVRHKENGKEGIVTEFVNSTWTDTPSVRVDHAELGDCLWYLENVEYVGSPDWIGPDLTPEEEGITSTISRTGPAGPDSAWDREPELLPAFERAVAERKRTDYFELRVHQLFGDAADLLLSKHRDYGPLNIARSPGGPLNGLRVRLWDKLARLNHLVDTGATPENESLEDTFRDIVGYGAIGLLVLRGDWPDE